MFKPIRIALAAALIALAPAATLARPHHATAAKRAPVTILVSIDGFRADYLSRGITPNLSALARGGTTATMRPSFPSVTFPNHWTLVTGMRPDHHGVVNGYVHDRAANTVVNMKTAEDPQWWSGADPIWVTAEKAGMKSATMFWPGSWVEIGGVRPNAWVPFSKAITNRMRSDMVLDWVRRPTRNRPRIVTVYFDAVDVAGHHSGPDSPEVNAAMRDVDAALGTLRDGLREMHQPANILVVSDHGMANVDQSRVIQLSDYANRADYVPVSGGSGLFVDAVPGHEEALAAGLAKLPPWVHCWRHGQLPAHFRYGTHPRVTDWYCLSDTGGAVLVTPPKNPPDRGEHGYDVDVPEMRALFVANGPAFPKGRTLPEFDNVDVEPLLRDLLKLPQTPGRDGDDQPFRKFLRSR